MSVKFTVVEALPPSKLREGAHSPSGFSPKLRHVREDDEFWLKKGWEYLLPATNLPARWSKQIGGEVIWAIVTGERGEDYNLYNFWRRKDHGFRRHALASQTKALQARNKFKLLETTGLKKPDDNELYSAVLDACPHTWSVEEPEYEVGGEVTTFSITENSFSGTIRQHTLNSESLNDFISDADWLPYYWEFSFSGKYSDDGKTWEITETEYEGDGQRPPLNLNNQSDRDDLLSVFQQHDMEEFLEDYEMTIDEFWNDVLPKYKWLKDKQ